MATDADGTTVGVFDSGVGGLTVVEAIHRLMPALSVRYIADTAYFPYGDRTDAEVEQRALTLALRLVDEGCDLVVVACNTASSAALERVRAAVPVPVVGMEPPLKPAVEATRSGRVAVLATAGTARGARLARLHEAYAGGVEVETLPLSGLADVVEGGEIDGARVESMLAPAIEAARRGADGVALGCTHYGFLKPLLQQLLPPGVDIFDAAEPVARRVRQQLEEYELPLPSGGKRESIIEVSATGDASALEETLARLRAAGAALPPLHVTREAGV